MTIGRRWAGKAFGTNIGNIFVTLEGEDSALTGHLRMNEPGVGIVVYSVTGKFESSTLVLTGEPRVEVDGAVFGSLNATGTLNARGEISGDWHTTIGSAGTFILFPHTGGEQVADGPQAEQFHIARHTFGAIEINREQIIKIAEDIRRDFPSVIVTVVAGTEQARFLDDFKRFEFGADRAEIIKVFASKTDGAGINQVVSLEFGPQINSAMSQGASEAWVLGKLETLKRDIKPVSSKLIGIARSCDPNGGGAFHHRWSELAPLKISSWGIGVIAAALAGALAAYLQGWLQPQPLAEPA
eukprot:gene20834-21547_t